MGGAIFGGGFDGGGRGKAADFDLGLHEVMN